MRSLFITLIFIFIIISGCASSTTGEPGISYGMSSSKVISKLESNSNEIVSNSNAEIVAIGKWEITGQIRKKVFLFRDDKLESVLYGPVEEN